jgi:hypothetical protein
MTPGTIPGSSPGTGAGSFDRTKLLAELERDEGRRLKAYVDTMGKVTIGYGRNLSDVGISEADAMRFLLEDISAAEAVLDANLPWWRTIWPLASACLAQHGLQPWLESASARRPGRLQEHAARDAGRQLGPGRGRHARLALGAPGGCQGGALGPDDGDWPMRFLILAALLALAGCTLCTKSTYPMPAPIWDCQAKGD